MQQSQKERTMGRMKDLAIEVDNMDKLVTDALRAAAELEQKVLPSGGDKVFREVLWSGDAPASPDCSVP